MTEHTNIHKWRQAFMETLTELTRQQGEIYRLRFENDRLNEALTAAGITVDVKQAEIERLKEAVHEMGSGANACMLIQDAIDFETQKRHDAEIERLRAALEKYADDSNWASPDGVVYAWIGYTMHPAEVAEEALKGGAA